MPEPLAQIIEGTLALNLPEDLWEEVGLAGDPGARLLFTLALGDLSMHFEAWALETDPDVDPDEPNADDGEGVQELAEGGDALDQLALAVGATSPFETTVIRGREYVLVASPFCT